MRRTHFPLLAGLLAGLLLLGGCDYTATGAPQDPEASVSSERYLESMDTIMVLTAYGSAREEALDAAEAEILRLDALLSTGDPDSEVSAINRDGGGVLSPDTLELVSRSLELYEETGGAFDITVYPLMMLWGFDDENYHVPTQEELTQTLDAVGSDRLTLDEETGQLTLDEGQAIDLGGIAKGYTSQRVMELYRAAGVTSGMVSLGGNIQCLGTRPDGTPWRIGIQDPWSVEGAIAAVIEVVDQAVITSGGYERYFVDEETGVTYQHILDPATGYPADSGLASVTIVSEDGTLADGLSTSLYLLGLEGSTDYWRAHSEQFEALLIDEAGAIYVTEGLADSVTAEDGFTVLTRQP